MEDEAKYFTSYRVRITETRTGWVEVIAESEEVARQKVLDGGFNSKGQCDCSFDRLVEIHDD